MAFYNWIRVHITSRLPIRLQYFVYLSLIPPFLVKQLAERLLGRKTFRMTWREKMQSFFDFLSPVYEHRFEPHEVVEWYQEEGFSNVQIAYREIEGFAVRGDVA